MSSSQGTPPNAAGGGNDPSMEDILASIRRILSEDEAVPAPLAATAAMPGAFQAQAQPAVTQAPPADPQPVAAKSVLALDSTMLVREPQPSAAISPGAPLAALSAIVSPGMETQVPPLHFSPPASAPVPQPAPSVAPLVQTQSAPAPVTAPQPAPPLPMPVLAQVPAPVPIPAASSLVAPETAAAATASVSTLVRTLTAERQTSVHRGGPTLEDIVREEMRPLLKQWLDTHLPPMVERLVRVEIERVVNRAAS